METILSRALNERGSAVVKAMILLILLGALGLAGLQFVPILFLYQEHRNFRDTVDAQVQSVHVAHLPDTQTALTNKIFARLDDMEAQCEQHHVIVNLEKEKKKISVQIWYSRPHRNFFLPNPKLFYVHVEKTGISEVIEQAQVSPSAPAKTSKPSKQSVKKPQTSPSVSVKKSKTSEKKNEKPIRGYSAPVIVTDATFVREVLQSRIPVMVDFWASWCGPCRQAAPAVDEAAQKFAGQIKITKLDIDKNRKTTSRYGVRGIPMFIFFKNGKAVGRQSGFGNKQGLFYLIQKYI